LQKKQDTWITRLVERNPPFFWWSLAIMLCFCLAVFSWMKIPPIFANPQDPENYKLLDKINRLDPIVAFSALEPPDGDIANTQNLYSKFGSLNRDELKALNANLIKNYVTNYKQQTLNTYIQGDFRVMKTRILTQNDRFKNGIAIKAEALVKVNKFTEAQSFPVWLEVILPNAPANAAKNIAKGDLIEINKNPFFASILYVERIERIDNDPIMSFTVVPLVYESPWNPPRNKEKFNIFPPKKLNMDAKLPIFQL
jgi:hypothetical protein